MIRQKLKDCIQEKKVKLKPQIGHECFNKKACVSKKPEGHKYFCGQSPLCEKPGREFSAFGNPRENMTTQTERAKM